MRILLLPWIFLIPILVVSVSGQCLKDQQSLLLQLKNTLTFTQSNSTKLSNWIQTTDCCLWNGVTCGQNGHITGLDLNSESISGGINHSSSLFSLQYLESLNLAFNSFNFTQIPSSIGNLTNLTYLNLSNAGLAGQIPIGLSRLTRLIILDLSALYFPGLPSLQIENPNLSTLFRNHSGVVELHLDGVNISANGYEWGQAISSSLPNLRILSLSNCYLSGPIDSSLQNLQFLSEINLSSNNLSNPVPDFLADFANLKVLRLSSSYLYGSFPENIFQQVRTLETLDLANNKLLNGSLPDFPPNGSLTNLVLSETSFFGNLPESLGSLMKLRRIEIPRCNFSGPIPNSLASLNQLLYLDFSSNNFTGPLPLFQASKNLTFIDLSHNALTGGILPTHFQGLLNLVYIDLAYNSFNGSIPSSLFSLPYLQKIQFSNNEFGNISGFFPNDSLSPLDTLDLSSNKLKGPLPSYFFNFSRLNILSLSFNNFSGTIQLESIQRLQNLTRLELSYNSLSVDVSFNISSSSSFPQLTILRLAACNLQNFPVLMNQSRIVHLDLSDNQISGVIPNWIWNIGNLDYLNLSCNLLVGLQSEYIMPNLGILDLHSNQLRGEIPLPPETAIYVDYSNNNFSCSIPARIGNMISFALFFSLSNNMLSGPIPPSICNGSYLQVLDLSNNRLSGTIPQCLVENCTGTLGVLNLGRNNLSGNILGTFPQGCVLKTLDLNGNRLEGLVPESLSSCEKLEVLNLGNNTMKGNFTCFLKNLASLRVLVLRSNNFVGDVRCPGINNNSTWPRLQIIDIAFNSFSGNLPPKCFLHWKEMMIAKQDLNHLRYDFLKLNNFYYQDKVTVTLKGLQLELVKILTVFTSVDFSHNRFEGEIPDTLGDLKSLYTLNLSQNGLSGPIPLTLENLSQLGSLDFSFNKLNGSIPATFARLNFLSVLDLSYNQLVGSIPQGNQFQTFLNTSYLGNVGLCGPPLSTPCNAPSLTPMSNSSVSKMKFHWQFIYIGLGFGMGVGFVVGPLLLWKRGSRWCDEQIDKFVWTIVPTLGLILSWRSGVKVEVASNIEEHETGDTDEDGYGEVMKEREFLGRFCVFCSKLDIHRKEAIHNPNCTCRESRSVSSSSFSSSSSYS